MMTAMPTQPRSAAQQASARLTVLQVAKAARHLSNVSRLMVPASPSVPASFVDAWQYWLRPFQSACVHVVDFIRELPHVERLTPTDRTTLTMRAFFPVHFACMSLDLDREDRDASRGSSPASLLSNDASAGNCADFTRMLRTQRDVMAGNTQQTDSASKLTIVEFGFLCALLFFNASCSGLEDPLIVEIASNDLAAAVDVFIDAGFGKGTPSAEQRRANIVRLVGFFTSSVALHDSMAADLSRQNPALVQTGGQILQDFVVDALKQRFAA